MSGARPFIVVGDKTDHGGEVLEGSPKALINGKMIARMGDKVHCPRACCRGTTTIVEGDSRVIVDGKPAAFHGAKTSCGAVLIASMVDNVMGGPPESELPPERDWSYVPKTQASQVSEFSWEALSAWPNTYVPADANESGQAPVAQPTKATDAEIQEYMRTHYAKRTFTQNQNTNLAINHKAIQIVRVGNTVTLRARVTVWGARAKDFSAAVMTRWNGLYYTDGSGVTYKTDIQVMEAKSQSDSIINLHWIQLEKGREQGVPNGDVYLNEKKIRQPVDPGMAAHEFGHAFFGLKDGYFEPGVYIRKDIWVTDPAYAGMEGSIMANSASGVVRLQDLKELISSYDTH